MSANQQEQLRVNSSNVHYSDEFIEVDYQYSTSHVKKQGNIVNVSRI